MVTQGCNASLIPNKSRPEPDQFRKTHTKRMPKSVTLTHMTRPIGMDMLERTIGGIFEHGGYEAESFYDRLELMLMDSHHVF